MFYAEGNQVAAAFKESRHRLATAAQEPSVTLACVKWLARSFEYAAMGLFVAWSYPVSATKAQRHFDSALATHLEGSDANLIRAVWADERKEFLGPDSELDLDVIVVMCADTIGRLEALANCAPPPGWSPPPIPPSIGWAALSTADQQILTLARQCVQKPCSQAKIVLFGSRANGTAKPESDYDLLVILPDGTEQSGRSAVYGNLHSLAQQLRIEIDRHVVWQSTWENPGPGDRFFINLAKTYGIEVPDSSGDQ